MVQLTARDDIRKASNEILKRIDQLIKGGEIDQAIREIIHAKEVDPANVYVLAYEERLAYLKEQHEKNIERERTKKEAGEAARKRDAELRSQLEEEQERQRKERERRDGEQKKQEERPKAEPERPAANEVPNHVPATPKIGSADRKYADAYRLAWSKGNIAPQQAIALQKLRGELGISPERQLEIDIQVLSDLEPKTGAITILVIDDDDQMRLLISEILTQQGYQVTSLASSDEAYVLLKTWIPRLIISDINLETSTMGGFSFYEKIRELKHLNDVPFIFLSGLSDEILIRAGKELGIDDYLTKPIAEETLLATVKGKLKRFGKFQRSNGNDAIEL